MANNCIERAVGIIKSGGLVSFPTETVYGLGADAFNANAIKRIYDAKGRPGDNPLILHIANIGQAHELAESLPAYATVLINKYWPGPLTIIVNKNQHLASWVGGHPKNITSTIGIRMPSHPVAQAFLQAVGCPIAAPSANKSGRPSPTTLKHVQDDFLATGEIEMMLDGAGSEIGIESTVVDITGEKPVILRHGAITQEMIENVTGMTLGNTNIVNVAPRSPGMKYKHYAPKAPMVILKGQPHNIAKYIASEIHNGRIGLLITKETQDAILQNPNQTILTLSTNQTEVAQNLFSQLRKFDEIGVTKIYAESVSTDGIGVAIMDRMIKAAEGNILQV